MKAAAPPIKANYRLVWRVGSASTDRTHPVQSVLVDHRGQELGLAQGFIGKNAGRQQIPSLEENLQRISLNHGRG